MRKIIIFLLASTAVFATSPMTKDFSKGKDLAEGHALPIALVFTGSDWSETSQALIDEMEKAPPSECILVQVDFPEINRQSEHILVQNQALKEKFEVENFPVVILINEKEEEITRMGYPIEGVESYGEHLRQAGRRFFLLQKRFEEAQKKKDVGELKVCYFEARSLGAGALAKEILDVEVEVPELLLEKYITFKGTEEGKMLRHKLEQIGKKEIASQLALLDFQEGKGVEPLEDFIEKFGEKSADQCWKMHMVLSEFLEEKEEALEHAQVSHRYAPPEERSIPKQLEESEFWEGGSSKFECGASDHCPEARRE